MTLTNAQNALLAKKNDIPFFAALSNEEVLIVAQHIDFVQLPKGARIFDQGEKTTALYYIVRGSVRIDIQHQNENGDQRYINIAVLQKKSFFGEMAFITHNERSAKASANEDDTAVLSFEILSNDDQHDICTLKALTHLYYFFARDLADKLTITNANYAKIKTIDDIPYDEIINLLMRAKEPIIKAAASANVLTIGDELFNAIAAFFPDGYDQNAQREVIKTALIETFGLSELDIIIFTKERAVVRLFQESAVNENSEKPLPLIDIQTQTELDQLFSNKTQFENIVLKIYDEKNIKTFVINAFYEILSSDEYCKYLNFKHLVSYNDFKLSKAVEALEAKITKNAKRYIVKKRELDERILRNNSYRTFMHTLAVEYIVANRQHIMLMIADTFIDTINSVSPIPEVIYEALQGTMNLLPILSTTEGVVTSKPEQIKMRIVQAEKEREKRNAAFKNNYIKAKQLLVRVQKNIEAFKRAKTITIADLKQLTFQELREIAINDEPKYMQQKRLLQYLPSGELTLYLRDLAAKGIAFAQNETAKEEYKLTYKFFENLHINNSPNTLIQKEKDLNAQLPKSEMRYMEAQHLNDEAESKRLEYYDEGLKRVYDAFILYAGKKR